ncbi:hypothetical protein CMO91_06435 [Candidatus Woesearchaeota archaeon]|nr:hypothetical protein [Candidatus Woesearchaeota archaeon]
MQVMPSHMRKSMYARLIKRGKRKYPGLMLRWIPPSGLQMVLGKRWSIGEPYYWMMREIDDVVDGDAPVPSTYTSAVEYLKQKIKFVQDGTPRDLIEEIMVKCWERLDTLGGRSWALRDATKDILSCMKFDQERTDRFHATGRASMLGKGTISKYFREMEFSGVMRCMLELIEGTSSKISEVEDLVYASGRHRIFLRDLSEDSARGLVNIPKKEWLEHSSRSEFVEFCERCKTQGRLSKENAKEFFATAPEAVRQWARKQVEQGSELLQKYSASKKSKQFGACARFILHYHHERPSRKFFAGVGPTVARL